MPKLSICIIWHDGLSGRGSEEVAAAYYLFLTNICRDVIHVVLWGGGGAQPRRAEQVLDADVHATPGCSQSKHNNRDNLYEIPRTWTHLHVG